MRNVLNKIFHSLKYLNSYSFSPEMFGRFSGSLLKSLNNYIYYIKYHQPPVANPSNTWENRVRHINHSFKRMFATSQCLSQWNAKIFLGKWTKAKLTFRRQLFSHIQNHEQCVQAKGLGEFSIIAEDNIGRDPFRHFQKNPKPGARNS